MGKENRLEVRGSRAHQFSIKYKAYSKSGAGAEKKKPSDHVKDLLNPPPAHRDGASRPKPCIIEKHNFSEQPYQLVSSVPEDEPLFQPFPPEINFSGYEPFKQYTAVLQLRNNDKAMRRVKVLPMDPNSLKVHQPYDQGNAMYTDIGTNKVACGMEVTYIVTFCPESDDDYQSELVIVTDREKFAVPVRCFGKKPIFSIPDEIIFPPTPVKCSSKKNLTIQNVGTKSGMFHISTSGAFTVNPTSGSLEEGSLFQCEIMFHPLRAESYEEELMIFYSQSNECTVSKVIGMGCELNVGLSSTLVMAPLTFIEKSHTMSLQLINESSYVAQFEWPEFFPKPEDSKEKTDVSRSSLYDAEDFSKMMREAFSLSPSKGEIWPGTVVDLTITFFPRKALRYIHTAHCVISGKSEPLEVEFQGTGIGPQAQLTPEFHDFGFLNLYSTYSLNVALQNTGELEAVYRLMGSLDSQVMSFDFQPDSGTVPPLESQNIEIQVRCLGMGQFNETFLWEVDGVLHNLSLNLQGCVGPPCFDLDTRNVDFGLVSYGVNCDKHIKLHNTSPVPLPFCFKIEKDGGGLSTYMIDPELCLLQPDEVRTLTLRIFPLEEKKLLAKFLVGIEGIADSIAIVPLQSECFSPQVQLSLESLDYGQCLIRYDYSQEIELINNSNVSAAYEVLPLANEVASIATVSVDKVNGIIPPNSQFRLNVTLVTRVLGQISVPVVLKISGKDSKPLSVVLSAQSIGPTVKIELPRSEIRTSITSDESEVSGITVDFGRVQVLQDNFKHIIVKNLTCIPAEVSICLSKKKTVFRLEFDSFVLEPFGSCKIQVTANLDDCVKFTDTIKITTEGSQQSVPLTAVGFGSTIICVELASGEFDFGKQVTLRPFFHSITVQNPGRKQLTLAWENKNAESLLTTGEKPIFSVAPEKTVLKSQSSCSFTLTGYALNPGSVIEELRCNVTTPRGVLLHKLSVKASVSPLKLLLSDTALNFVQSTSRDESSQELTKILMCTNVSELPVIFELYTKPPFLVSNTKCTLQPSESINVMVNFEKQYSEERLSKVMNGILEIIYTGTTEKEYLKLSADVQYPNLIFSTSRLEFGCVIENTMKKLYLNVRNDGPLVTNYHWFFLEDDDGVQDSLCSEGKLSLYQIFDILPIRGCLGPGEEETIEFSYYAYPGYTCCATAICEVQDGPGYKVQLEAESALISYSLSEKSLDFGLQQFNSVVDKTVAIINSGKIPLSFNVGLPSPTPKPYLKVTPLSGNLEPSQKQVFKVSICPVLPEKYETKIEIQISHFLPEQICITGEGIYPCVSLDLPRIRNNMFLEAANTALQNLWNIRLKSTPVAPSTSEEVAGEQNSTEQMSLSEIMQRELSLERVDAEIDRCMFVERLVEPDETGASLSEGFTSESNRLEVEKFVLNKYICDFGDVIIGESQHKVVHISNASGLPISFKGEKTFLRGTGFLFEPEQQLRLSGGQFNGKSLEFNVMLKTDHPKFKGGLIEACIPLHIKEAPRTIVLLKANVTKPILELSTELLEFESVQLGHCKTMYIQLHNSGKVPCTWEVSKPESKISDFSSIRDAAAFSFLPSSGTVLPNEYFNLEVRFMPSHKRHNYSVKYPFKLLHTPELRFISCKGQSYSLAFNFEPAEIELAPIIPKGSSPVEFSVDLVNSSDQDVEVFSVDFDTQYIEEEKILYECNKYNEDGLLFLQPREAGKPFWTELMPIQEPVPSQTQPEKVPSTPVKEKPTPPKKGQKKQKEEPIPPPVVEPPLFKTDTPIFIVHGPPLTGKTTQAKLLSLRYNIPAIDMQDFINQNAENILSSMTENNNLNDTTQTTSIPGIDISPQERELVKSIKETLKKSDYANGVIIDGLHSNLFESTSIAKCVLLSVGLQPSAPPLQLVTDSTIPNVGSNTQNDGFNTLNDAFNTQNDGLRKRTLWNGNPLIYVLVIDFDKEDLLDRYDEIPATHHAKNTPQYLLNKEEYPVYPYCSRIPSNEALDDYFHLQPFLFDLFGHGEEEEAAEPQNRVHLFKVDGMLKENSMFEAELGVLPSPGVSSGIPTPRTFQVIRKPSGLTSSTELVGSNFSILTPLANNEDATKKGKDGAKLNGKSPDLPGKGKKDQFSDQFSDAASVFDDKVSIAAKSVATRKDKSRKDRLNNISENESYSLNTIPEGFSKQSRWIIPAHSRVNLKLLFWSASEQRVNRTFLFQAVGSPGRASFHCKAICARPQVSCYFKKPAASVGRSSAFVQTQSQKFKKENILDFGTIQAGITPVGFPGIQDSEHSIRLTIHNTGLFDLHVDFDIVANLPNASSQKSSKQSQSLSPFFLHPVSMDLKMDEKQDLRLYSYPKQDQLGTLEGKLTCRVLNSPDNIEFALKSLSDTPRMKVEPLLIAFDRLLIGLQENKEISIRNICALPIQWKLVVTENAAKEFTFSETAGTLDVDQSRVIKVTFNAIEERLLKEKFTLQVFNTKDQVKPAQEFTLNITAEAFKMEIIVKNENAKNGDNCGFDFGTLRVAEDSLKFLIAQNKGKYAVSFRFLLKGIFSEIFTVSPIEGTLEPKKDQKVEVHFNKNKKLNKEVHCEKSQDFQLLVSDILTKKPEKKIVVPVTLRAVHSKFTLIPSHGIHFGSQICGTISAAHPLSILNVGELPFRYKISAMSVQSGKTDTPPMETNKTQKKSGEAEKPGKGGEGKKSPRSRKRNSTAKQIVETLDLKCFTLSPTSGIINPNEKQDVSVFFKAEVMGCISENIRVEITDVDRLQYPEPIVYNIAGESCMPGITTNPEIIFEEHNVVEYVNLLRHLPTNRTFSRKDNVFFFGALILGSALQEDRKSESRMDCQLKIENPYKVPCSLKFSISSHPDQGRVTSPCMFVSPEVVDIPPLEHRFITISYIPATIGRHSATFETLLVVKGENHASLFKCDLIGEGALPQLIIESPSARSISNAPSLTFPRLLIGNSHGLPIVLQNNGSVSVTAKIEARTSDTSWMTFTSLSGTMDVPYYFGTSFSVPGGEKKVFTVIFTPKDKVVYKGELQLIIDGNPFENSNIQITGEGYDDDVIFTGLPKNSDNQIHFEDCPIGDSKSLQFDLKNKAGDKHWHFQWPDIACVKFSPVSGYILAGESKSICATFCPDKPMQYVNQEIKLELYNIIIKGDAFPPINNELQQKDQSTKALAKETPSKKSPDTSGKSISKPDKPRRSISKADPQSGGVLDLDTGNEVVKGSLRVLTARLHAVADTLRYECSAKEIIFKSTMMFQRRAYSFLLKNPSNAMMPFTWRVQKLDGSPDEKSMYMVTPLTGSVEAKKQTEITVRFCPTEVEECVRNLVCDICHLSPACPPLKILLNGKVSRPWCYFDLPRSDYASRRPPALGPLDPDMNVIEFECVGSGFHNIKYFIATNPTSKSYKFVWERKQKHHLQSADQSSSKVEAEPFKCMTRSGEIRSGTRYEMAFEFNAPKGDLQESLWVFKIPEQEIQVPFLLVGNVKQPALSFDRTLVNFGQVLVGHHVKQMVQLVNEENVTFSFNFLKSGSGGNQTASKPILDIQPASGDIRPSSVVPIKLTFTPDAEGLFDIKAVCSVKKSNPLYFSIKGEAYQYHDKIYLEAADNGAPIQLLAEEINKISIGSVLANEKAFRRFTICNYGAYPFQFFWDWGQNTSILIEPCGGTIGKDEQLTCELSVFMENLKDEFEIPLTCNVMHGNKYDLKISGTCNRPNLRFSFLKFDFGPCFLHHTGNEPPSTELLISNDGNTNISCEALYKSTTFLEVDQFNAVIEGGQTCKVKITFKPDSIAHFKEVVRFCINGLDTATVLILGEGTPIYVDVCNPLFRTVAFGLVQLGQGAKRQVDVINKSKLPVHLSFEQCNVMLQQYGVTCSPKDLKLEPKQVEPIEIHFNPQRRIRPFTEAVTLAIAGTSLKLLSVSGVCLASDVKLSSSIIPFDPVTLGSQTARKVKIENDGDLAATFSWDNRPCGTEFSISPADGTVAAHQAVTVEVVFHPTLVSPEVRVENIPCIVTGGKTLFLTLTGCCNLCEARDDILSFSTPVRKADVKTIQLENGTESDWTIHPKIENEFWKGSHAVTVPAGGAAGYEITYQPHMMSKASEKHEGSILFPIPDGSAIMYKLQGVAGPPLPDGEFTFDVKARSYLSIALPVKNWLKASQKFVVSVKQAQDSLKDCSVFKGPKSFDVPGLSRKDCVFSFYSFKTGQTKASIELKNEASGEYMFFNVSILVTTADVEQCLSLQAVVREKVIEAFSINNPLDKAVTFSLKCSNPEITVAPTVEVQANASAEVEVTFRPLLERESMKTQLLLENPLLGEYVYDLQLRSVAGPMEPPMRFFVSFGNQSVQVFKFFHFLPAKATFTCEFAKGAESGFSVVNSSIVANPAGKDGLEVQVPVSYEPSYVGERVGDILTVKSSEAGIYQCYVEGTSSAPIPQGPFVIKGATPIPFKNVFPKPVQYNYSVDNPAFLVGKGDKLTSKQAGKISVNFKASSSAVPTGKLTVSCPETTYSWVFYLQGST